MIAIIGGSGFIGSRLAKRFVDNKVEFIIVDKVKSPFFNDKTLIADVRDFEALKKSIIGVSAVINLAAEHRDDVSPKSLYDEVNVQGAINVCRACIELDIHQLIFTSSVAVYGFAPKGTDETGEINYFNDYGRTKWLAENVYRDWLIKDNKNSLTIIRPTVVFGERNRGNVYNLLKQISSGMFPMIGNGKNLKSMAYVENVAAFIEYSMGNKTGEYLFNYVDKPDFDMNSLVLSVKSSLGKKRKTGLHWPYWIGFLGGCFFDFIAMIINKKLPISSIRIKKFCSDSSFDTSVSMLSDFIVPESLENGIKKTIQFEFIEKKDESILFYTE